jgi:two-component system, LytTR family, response regulator
MPTKDTISGKTLNTVIVDDDVQSRKILGILLKKFPEVKVVGEASNISSAVDIIEETKPDSIFLDIQLGTSNGFELIGKISDNAKVIFVSAYDDYALRAFEVNALDYLKKPIEKDRLAITVSRLLAMKNNDSKIDPNDPDINEIFYKNNDEEVPTLPRKSTKIEFELHDTQEVEDSNGTDLEEGFEENIVTVDPSNRLEYDDRLFITADGVSKFIKISSIQCITAEKDYSYIYLTGSKKLLILKPMVEWEERLTPKYFVRIHRSTIVNLEYVEKVEKWFNASYRVYMQNIAEPFQMSRRYASKLKERFK